MSEEEFKSHQEALAAKRLEKPKKLSSKNGKFWAEILSEHLHFDRDNIEVEELRKLTKDDILNFYTEHIAPSGEQRRKLACHVVSHHPEGAGKKPLDPSAEETPSTSSTDDKSADQDGAQKSGSGSTEKPANDEVVIKVKNIAQFKAGQPLYPLGKPFTPPENLVRNLQEKKQIP
eukprot:TRINITY_DN1823_c0_g1_i7.p1 TRINITY_DN1823_c0_g1~~TRINITY_DN1823_c0_g1_i7.p1  ORF type:complete len:175 (-),score=48.64 TRINITY_DN1823_c0_g1_i7:151-675(-)